MLKLTEGTGVNARDGLGGQRQGERECSSAKFFWPGEACCAEIHSCSWTFFDRDYWILVTPGMQLLVPLPMPSILYLCMVTLINTVQIKKSR